MESIGPLAPTASPLTRISERNPPFREIVQPLGAAKRRLTTVVITREGG